MMYSIILPSYLEEENLRILVPRIIDVLNDLKEPYEIIVVDTVDPLDASEKVCIENGIKYVRRSPGNSFGDAVRTGIKNSQGEYVIFMDADGSHTPEFIPTLVQQKNNADVVIASRYVDGGYSENDKTLLLMSRFLNLTYALILNLKCKDVSNSFKIYRGEQIRALKLSCQNFDIVEEILFKLSQKNKNFKIIEVPFSFKKRMFGETKRNLFIFMITYLYTLIKLRFSKD